MVVSIKRVNGTDLPRRWRMVIPQQSVRESARFRGRCFKKCTAGTLQQSKVMFIRLSRQRYLSLQWELVLVLGNQIPEGGTEHWCSLVSCGLGQWFYGIQILSCYCLCLINVAKPWETVSCGLEQRVGWKVGQRHKVETPQFSVFCLKDLQLLSRLMWTSLLFS